MEIEEIKTFLEANKADEKVKAFLAEITPKVSSELISTYLETEEGTKLVATHPATDRRVTEGVKTAVDKERVKIDAEVKRLVAAEMLKANPQETSEQKQIREIREQLDTEKQARARETLTRQLIEESSKLGVDINSVISSGYMPGSFEEGQVFLKNLKKRDDDLESKIRNDIAGSGFKPGSGQGDKGKVDLSKMSKEQMRELEMKGELDKYLSDNKGIA